MHVRSKSDQVLDILENLGHDGKDFGFPYGNDRWLVYIFSLSRFLDRFAL